MRKFLTILVMLVSTTIAIAQNKTVTGKVIDEKGAPVVNASVIVKGTASGVSTKEDAVVWAKYIKQNWPTMPTIVQINTEQFKLNSDGSLAPADSTEVIARENYYRLQNASLGPAWEIRYWNKRLYGL